MFAAVAMVVMNLGSLIPVATYVCPVICMLILAFVTRLCGNRIGWGWYGAVAMLSLLMAPDKEAAAVFCGIGCYPILKPKFDGRRGKLLWKLVYFNGSILVLYWLLLRVIGLQSVSEDFAAMGAIMTLCLLVLGNVTFFLLDRLLSTKFKIH